MTVLLQLPNEILLRIVYYVPFSTIEDFALTCKSFNHLAQTKLCEHNQKKSDLSTIVVGRLMGPRWPITQRPRQYHPLHYLQRLFTIEEYTLYPKRIIFGGFGGIESIYGAKDVEGESQALQAFCTEYEDQIYNLAASAYAAILPDEERDVVQECKWIKSGHVVSVLKLLVLILPNLQTLEALDNFSNMDDFKSMLNDVAFSAQLSQPNSTGPLCKLSRVCLYSSSEGLTSGCGTLMDFLALPSVQKIECEIMDGEYECWDEPIEPGSSNVRDISFIKSGVPAKQLREILSTTEVLQKFTYNFEIGEKVSPGPTCSWEPRYTVQALSVYARKTLRHLELTADITWNHSWAQLQFNTMEPYIGSLRDFIVLEFLKLQTSTLFKEVEDPPFWDAEPTTPIQRSNGTWVEEKLLQGSNRFVEPQRFLSIMPAALKSIELVGGVDIGDARVMLGGLSELKQERLPNLSTINFKDNDPFDQEIIHGCEAVGIKLSCWVRDGYFAPK